MQGRSAEGEERRSGERVPRISSGLMPFPNRHCGYVRFEMLLWSAGDGYKKPPEAPDLRPDLHYCCHFATYITARTMSAPAPDHNKPSMDGTTINFNNSAKGHNEPLPMAEETNELDRYVTDDLPRQPRMAAKPQVPDAIMVNIAVLCRSPERKNANHSGFGLGRSALEEERDATLLCARSWYRRY